MAETSRPALIGILTVSDRAAAGIYPDEGGPAIRATLDEMLASSWQAVNGSNPKSLAAWTTAQQKSARARE